MTDSTPDGNGKRGRTAPSLRNRNFRRYLLGQGVSHTGMWLQQTAELWLVLQLTGSGTALGVATALRWGPLLVLGAYGGLLGDRVNRRHLLMATAVLQAAGATVLAAAAWSSPPPLTVVYTLILIQGVFSALDNPMRRSFVRDLVPDELLTNAVSLNGMVGTLARTVGPALGGVTITLLGVAWCFAINAATYAAVLLSLLLLDVRTMRRFTPVTRDRGQVRAGISYAWANPRLRVTLVFTAVVSIFAWNWNVLLPVYATEVFSGDASLYGSLVSLLSAGSLLGALITARRSTLGGRHLLLSGGVLALALLITALAPGLVVAAIGLLVLGASGTSFTIGAQTRLQLNVEDSMNGRVMALFAVGWLGSKPVGGLIGGWIMDLAGARVAFAVGAVAVGVVVAVVGVLGRRPPRPTSG